MERLTDTERKLLQICWNRNRTNVFRIDIPHYALLAGREAGQIRVALRGLADKGYIEWDSTFGRVQVINTYLLTGLLPANSTPFKSWEWER